MKKNISGCISFLLFKTEWDKILCTIKRNIYSWLVFHLNKSILNGIKLHSHQSKYLPIEVIDCLSKLGWFEGAEGTQTQLSSFEPAQLFCPWAWANCKTKRVCKSIIWVSESDPTLSQANALNSPFYKLLRSTLESCFVFLPFLYISQSKIDRIQGLTSPFSNILHCLEYHFLIKHNCILWSTWLDWT